MQRNISAFQRHLLFFGTNTTPARLTVPSATHAALSLGLDFPVAVLLSLSLRFLYTPVPNILSSPCIEDLPPSRHRQQLEGINLEKERYTCKDLLELLPKEPGKGFLGKKLDQGHIVGFWAIAADTKTHVVDREDVERFQEGRWQGGVVKRRRGREDVLPLWRGGPIVVEWHNWAVRKIVGVRVYEEDDNKGG